jgi:hypothetical protein
MAQNVLEKPTTNRSKNQYLSVQWLGLTYHPGGGSVRMRDKYPLRLDPKANFVINIGAVVNYDVELSKRFFVRGSVAAYMDCAWQKAMYANICFRLGTRRWGRHNLNFGMGPALTMREDWGKFETYKRGDDIFGNRLWQGWQYRIIPYAADIEYMYQLNDRIQIQYSVIPGVPTVVTSRIGVRFKLS